MQLGTKLRTQVPLDKGVLKNMGIWQVAQLLGAYLELHVTHGNGHRLQVPLLTL